MANPNLRMATGRRDLGCNRCVGPTVAPLIAKGGLTSTTKLTYSYNSLGNRV